MPKEENLPCPSEASGEGGFYERREVFYTEFVAGRYGNKIKSGARLVTKPEEILEDLGISSGVIGKSLVDLDNTDLTSEEKVILSLLSEGVKETNDLIRRSNLAANIVSSTLAMLEIKGLLKQMGASEYRLL